MDLNKIDYDFAKAWDLNQGDFAHEVAENILNFASKNGKKISTVLDVCCGSSNLLEVFEKKGLKCHGTEARPGMYEYSKTNHPGIEYTLTEQMYDIPMKQKFDLITCTHDIVNYFETFENWSSFFENAYKHLNKNGMFVFDYYTKYKLQHWKETTYKQGEHLDYLMTVKSGVYDKTVISYTYFVKNDSYYLKTKDVVVESYYDNEKIFKALKEAGFKKVIIADKNLDELENYQYTERIHIVAMKK